MKAVILSALSASAALTLHAMPVGDPPGCQGAARSAGTTGSEVGRIVAASHQPAAKADIVETAVAAGTFKTLAAALEAAGLVEALKGKGPFTVFAPTDEAFARLPAGTVEELLKPENRERLAAVLKYHVVSGKALAKDVTSRPAWATLQGQRIDIKSESGKVTVDGAKVVKTDIEATNGVIHVIDAVMLPASKDIVETAASAGTFNTLAAALQAAGLVETLQGAGPFTVFAPTDEAFAKLPAGTVEELLKPENKARLVSVLTYHVVPGAVYSDQVAKMKDAATVQGGKVAVSVKGKSVMIDNAKVAAADIEASNGVIHVIDTVLMPK